MIFFGNVQFLALVDVILCLMLMLYHVCAVEVDGRNDGDYGYFYYFYVNYLAGKN